MAVALKRGRVKRRIFDSIIENFTGAVPNNSDDFKNRMLRRNPYVCLFETTPAAAPKYGNSECQKVLDPVPPQQASREHSQNDGKHGGSMNRRPVALKRGRVKGWIFESIIEKFTGAVPNNSDDFKSCMIRWNPYVWLFETTAAAAPKSGNSECQKVDDMIPVPPQQASREHEHDGKHEGSMKRGRVKRQIFESIIENFTGAVPNNSDDFKSCMLRWNPYVWLFETTGAAAPEYGNSECQEVVDMIPVPPQQASREHEHSQNDGKHGGSVVNTIITGNIIYANNSTKILALKSKEPVESINLNKETGGSCSNRSENNSDIKLDISRTPAIDSPQAIDRTLFSSSLIRPGSGTALSKHIKA